MKASRLEKRAILRAARNAQASAPSGITCEPYNHVVARCNCCGVSNYHRSYEPETTRALFEVAISDSSQILCAPCLNDLSRAIFPFREGS